MHVIGIDPAPSKKTCIYDQEKKGKEWYWESAVNVPQHLWELSKGDRAQTEGLLVCWDAPLTGPPYPDHSSGNRSASDEDKVAPYSQRVIESLISKADNKLPEGISTMPYSGCSHWAITRAALGLPRVGPWDRPIAELPFTPCFENRPPKQPGAYVTEVHPALALWLWGLEAGHKGPWNYKKDPGSRDELWTCLKTFWASQYPRSLGTWAPEQVRNDDELDAWVAFALGRLWVDWPEEVRLAGDNGTGSFLLPNKALQTYLPEIAKLP